MVGGTLAPPRQRHRLGVYPERADSRLTGARRIIGKFANPYKETAMRRDTFLKSLAALAAAGALPLSARAAAPTSR